MEEIRKLEAAEDLIRTEANKELKRLEARVLIETAAENARKLIENAREEALILISEAVDRARELLVAEELSVEMAQAQSDQAKEDILTK